MPDRSLSSLVVSFFSPQRLNQVPPVLVSILRDKLPARTLRLCDAEGSETEPDGATTFLSQLELSARFMPIQAVIQVLYDIRRQQSMDSSAHPDQRE